MNTSDESPSWVDKKIADLNTQLHFDFRSPLPPDACVESLKEGFRTSPYNLQVIIETGDAGAFYFHIMEYNPIGVQIEGNVTSLGNGSLVDGRIIRPGCALTLLLLYGILPLLIIGIGMFLLAIITRNAGLISNAILMMVAGTFLGYVFASYSRRHRNYMRIIEATITTGKVKNSNKNSAVR